jgi:threonine/homoserine/homoserine lactone efflux protein
MNALLRVACWGLAISALGTLPLGAINIAAMQVSISEGVVHAVFFSLGAALVEVVYVRISLVGINWIRHRATLLRYMDWLAFGIVAALAISSFIAAAAPSGSGKNIILSANVHPFILGLGMSAVNPMQLPFWFGWSTVLFGKGILQATHPFYNWYTIGIGLGTLTGLAIFVIGGQVLVQKMNAHQQGINYFIAGIFAITALIFLYKIIFNKGAVAALQAKGVEVDDKPEL